MADKDFEPQATEDQTLMLVEAKQSPDVVATQLASNQARIEEIVQSVRAINPEHIVVAGRGSSGHASLFAKYLFETELQIVTSVSTPSVLTQYGVQPRVHNSVFLVISQSGRSDDLILLTQQARAAGAFTVAMVNDETSPLATCSDAVIPICAGPENSVAATKSYIASLSAICHLTAAFADNKALMDGLQDLPQQLAQAGNTDWQSELATLRGASQLIVTARGFHYAVACELALKFKETCLIQAESFSTAELAHGPAALASTKTPIICLPQSDAPAATSQHFINQLEQAGAEIIRLPEPLADNHKVHPRLEPLLTAQAFYTNIPFLAKARGLNPDSPSLLNKVTRTL